MLFARFFNAGMWLMLMISMSCASGFTKPEQTVCSILAIIGLTVSQLELTAMEILQFLMDKNKSEVKGNG